MQKYDQIPRFMWKLTGREKEKKKQNKKNLRINSE